MKTTLALPGVRRLALPLALLLGWMASTALLHGQGSGGTISGRVFNPVTQGKKFDPDGEYVRRWVPELAHLPGGAVHEPWKHELGYEGDYPRPVVEHDVERKVALARYSER